MRQDSVELESLEHQQTCQIADALLCRGPPQLTRLTSSDRDDDTPPADIDDEEEEEEGERPGSTTVPLMKASSCSQNWKRRDGLSVRRLQSFHALGLHDSI